MEYLIKQYPLETGALEIQYIEETFGEFPRKKTAREIVARLRDREFLILMAEAPLPDDPGMIVPVSFKVVHEIRADDVEPKLVDLVDPAQRRRAFDRSQGAVQLDWRDAARLARPGSLPRADRRIRSLGAHLGFHEVVVKTKNRFYDMRGTLDQLEFNVIKYEVNRDDNRESKVYLGKQLTSDVVRAHTSTRTVVYAD